MSEIKEIDVMIIANSTLITNKLKQIIENSGINVTVLQIGENNLIPSLKEKKPDVVLVDVSFINKEEQLINEIVMILNIPLIILSSASVHDTAKTVYAITNGASDFILRDRLNIPYYQEEIVNKIFNVASSLTIKRKMKRHGLEKGTKQQDVKKTLRENVHNKKTSKKLFEQIIAIGTSTGGPKALQIVLSKLPKNFPAPIVIVQHMPSGFTKSLAERLNNLCQINVKEAVDGEQLKPGTAYIAPGNYHMAVNNNLEISIYRGRERDGHRPSVNILFESIAKLHDVRKVAVILTGMGKDGATGVKKMKESDEATIIIVESEETAIINGMPRATLETGYVTEVTRLENIGDTIVHYIMKRGN